MSSVTCTVSDDGLPTTGSLSTTWSLTAGPRPLNLTPVGSAGVQFTPPAGGTYVLSLTANDGSLSSAASVRVDVAIRLLQLGDSITQGFGGQQSYRYPLWKKLMDAGANVDLVGSNREASGGTPSWPDYNGRSFDLDHEGHSGWTAGQVANFLPSWLTGYTLDIALIHLGTNDLGNNGGVDGALFGLTQVVERLRSANPNVHLYVAHIIPVSSAWSPVASAAVSDLNDRLSSWASGLQMESSPIRLVDQHSGFSVDSDTYDGAHPNSIGEEKIAQRWFDALSVSGEFK